MWVCFRSPCCLQSWHRAEGCTIQSLCAGCCEQRSASPGRPWSGQTPQSSLLSVSTHTRRKQVMVCKGKISTWQAEALFDWRCVNVCLLQGSESMIYWVKTCTVCLQGSNRSFVQTVLSYSLAFHSKQAPSRFWASWTRHRWNHRPLGRRRSLSTSDHGGGWHWSRQRAEETQRNKQVRFIHLKTHSEISSKLYDITN